MKRKTFWTSMIAVLAVMFCASLATAEPGSSERKADGERVGQNDGEKKDKAEKRKGHRGHMLFADIDLTDDQKMQIKEIRMENKERVQEIRQEMKEARDAKDKEAMKAAGEKMQTLMEQTHGEIRGVLTAEQQKQFDKNVQEMKERREARREKMKERRDKGEGKSENGGDEAGD